LHGLASILMEVGIIRWHVARAGRLGGA